MHRRAFCLVVVLACVVGATWLIGLPDYSTISSYANTGITTIYANDRETVLAKLYLENRIEISQDEVVDYVLEGTIATEDERFYEHGGIDPIGIARAVIVNAAPAVPPRAPRPSPSSSCAIPSCSTR